MIHSPQNPPLVVGCDRQSVIGRPDEGQANFIDGLNERVRKFAELITEGRQMGEIAADLDPRAVARVFMALLTGLELQKIMEPDLDLDALLPVVLSLLRGSFTVRSGR